MEGTEIQAVTHQDSTEELKDSQDQIENTEVDNKEKEEYSIGRFRKMTNSSPNILLCNFQINFLCAL